MAQNFIFKAKNRKGEFLDGTIAADNEAAVASYVRDKGYFVVNIKPAKGAGFSSLQERLEDMRTVKRKELALLCKQFSTMIDAGLPIVSSLNILVEQIENPRLKKALQDVYKRVKEGDSFSKSLGAHPKIFPAIMINMVEAGELGGMLDEVMRRLASHFEKEYKMIGKVKSALTYPAIIMVIAVLAVMIVMTFVVPTFAKLFTDMGMQLPLPTQILIGISGFLHDNILFLLLAAVGAVFAFGAASKQYQTRRIIDMLTLRIPILGMIFEKVAVARFTRTLSTLVRSGVSLLLALEVVKKATGNIIMMEAITKAQQEVKEGVSLAKTLGNTGLFNNMVIQMILIGEESGSLDQMLEKVADFYENDVDDIVSRISSIVEPIIIVFLGTAIGGIAVSIVMPMFDLIANAGG